MNLFRKGALTLCALLSLSFAMPAQQANAEGFATPLESSARGMALGGGLVARGGDASVIAYNPAAMTRLEGTQVQGNLSITQMFWGVDNFKDGSNAHSSHQTWPIPSWYLTHQWNDKVWLGIGQFTRFGLGVKYPQGWFGGANLQAVKLITSSITPTLAYKLNDKVSLAVGAEVLYADMQMRKNIGQYVPGLGFYHAGGDMNLNGHGFAFGGNVSLHVQWNDKWSTGFMYRAPMSLKVNGKARWDKAGVPATQLFPGSMGSIASAVGGLGKLPTASLKNKVRGTIHLPDSFAFGVAYKPIETLSLEAAVTYTLWDRFNDFNIYMKAPINAWNNNTKDWQNNLSFSLSGEWWATDWMALRLGFVFDRSPNNYGHADYMMPSNGRHYYTCGVGFKWENWTLDLSYMYAHNHELNYTESEQNGTTGVVAGRTTHPHAHNFGIGIGYKF